MQELKIVKIGNSEGVILPKAVLERLKLGKGDKLFMVEDQDGVRLTPYDAAFERQMDIADDVMKRYRNTLRELAK